MDNRRNYTSIYNIKNFMKDIIAPQYFDLDDVSQANVGLLGFITETQGTVTEDTFNATSRFINEVLPNKARLPEFVYSHAELYGVSDFFSYCAKMPVYIFIKESDIINNGKKVQNHKEFVLDSDLTVFVEDIPFSIPYNIIIRSSQYKGVYNHQCVYDTVNKNSLSQIKTPYIKSVIVNIEGDPYLSMSLDVYQYTKKKIHENIISNNKLNIPYIEAIFDSKICNFEAFYKPANSNTTSQLIKELESAPPIKEPFIYYKLTDENELRFSFSNDDRYFVPDFNSDLYIELYETLAEKGNFELYKGNDVFMTLSSEIEEYKYNNEVVGFAICKGDSSGGKNNLTLEEIRRLSLEKMITVSSYTTDNDLSTYFLNYATVHDTEALFIKERDDFADRIFGCYTLIKDLEDILPTNTLNLRFNKNEVDEAFDSIGRYIIKAGTTFVYLDENERDTCRIDRSPTISDFKYMTLPMISISKNPNNVAFYINSINKRLELEYTYMNRESVNQFIINNCNIKRNAIKGETRYNIELTLLPSNNAIGDNPELDEIDLSPNLKVLLYINTEIGHYIELSFINKTDNKYVFGCEIETDDMIDENRIKLLDIISRMTGNPEDRMIKMQDPNTDILVFFKYEDGFNIPHKYEDIKEVTGMTLTNTYKPLSGELYFAYPMNLISSTVKFTPGDTPDNYVFNLSNVPLFQEEFERDEHNVAVSLNKLETQHKFLLDISTKHTSNYSIHMKFYNTYGKSRFFNINDTETLLNRVNCSIRMRMSFYEGIIIGDYITNIKRYIKEYIESINGLNSGVNTIIVSALTQALHNEFNQIKKIYFESINEYPSSVQSVEMPSKYGEDKHGLIPEYLTINEEDIIITTM